MRPFLVAVGDQAVRRPGVGDDDLGLDVAAEGGLHAGEQFVVRRDGLAGLEGEAEGPAVAIIHRAGGARRVGVDQPVHDGGLVADDLTQPRRADDHVEVLGVGVAAFHLRADRLAHAAARAVGADCPGGTQGAALAGGDVTHRGGDAGRVLRQAGQLCAHQQGDGRQFGGAVAQHALHLVLRNPLHALGVALVALAGHLAEEGVLEAGQFMAE